MSLFSAVFLVFLSLRHTLPPHLHLSFSFLSLPSFFGTFSLTEVSVVLFLASAFEVRSSTPSKAAAPLNAGLTACCSPGGPPRSAFGRMSRNVEKGKHQAECAGASTDSPLKGLVEARGGGTRVAPSRAALPLGGRAKAVLIW